MKRIAVVTLLAMVGLGVQANAKPWYFSLGAGAVFPSKDSSGTADSDSVLYSPTTVGTSLFMLPNVEWKNTYETGGEANAALGYSMNKFWRIEGEFIYQNINRDISGDYDWREQSTTPPFAVVNDDVNNPITHSDSTTNVYSLMSNIFYDFDTGTRWTPSIGVGIGVAWIDSASTTSDGRLVVELNQPPLDVQAPTVETSPSLYGTAFAWQVKLGMEYSFYRDTMSMGIHYRLFGTTDFQASSSEIITNPSSAGQAAFNVPQTDIEGLLNNTVFVGWKYKW